MMMTFHRWLQFVMAERGMTQADLARLTKAGSGLVSLWYRGEKTPSTKYIPAIAAALDRTEQQILSALEGRDASPAANLDAQTKAAISRLFGLPADFSEEEALLVRDLVHVVRRWQETMQERESVRAAAARGPRLAEEESDHEASGASR